MNEAGNITGKKVARLLLKRFSYFVLSTYRKQMDSVIFGLGIFDVPNPNGSPFPTGGKQDFVFCWMYGHRKDSIGNDFGDSVILKKVVDLLNNGVFFAEVQINALIISR